MFLSPSNTVFGIYQCSSLRIDGKKLSLNHWLLDLFLIKETFKKHEVVQKPTIRSTRLYGNKCAVTPRTIEVREKKR